MRIQVFWDVTPCLAEQFLTVHLQGQVVYILLGLLDPEDEGTIFIQNTGKHSSSDTVSQPQSSLATHLQCPASNYDAW